MSFRVGTPNYGLPQTEGTDKRDWSDTNQPFLLIDTAIKNAVDTSASASSAAATAQTTADSATTAASHAQTDATTAQTLATSASELATVAKNRADSAYTLADENKAVEILRSNSGETYGAFGARLVSAIANLSDAQRSRLVLQIRSSTSNNFHHYMGKPDTAGEQFGRIYWEQNSQVTRLYIFDTNSALRSETITTNSGTVYGVADETANTLSSTTYAVLYLS